MKEKIDYAPFRKALELETASRKDKKRPKTERDLCNQAFKEVRERAKSQSKEFRRVVSTLIRRARPGIRNIVVGYHLLETDIHERHKPLVYFQEENYNSEISTCFGLPELRVLRELGLPIKVALVMHQGAICWAVFTSIPY